VHDGLANTRVGHFIATEYKKRKKRAESSSPVSVVEPGTRLKDDRETLDEKQKREELAIKLEEENLNTFKAKHISGTKWNSFQVNVLLVLWFIFLLLGAAVLTNYDFYTYGQSEILIYQKPLYTRLFKLMMAFVIGFSFINILNIIVSIGVKNRIQLTKMDPDHYKGIIKVLSNKFTIEFTFTLVLYAFDLTNAF